MRRTSWRVLLGLTTLALAACGGGSSVSPAPATHGSPVAPAFVSVTIRIDVPGATQSTKRRPAYLSAATQSITISVNGATPVAQNLTPSGGSCSTPSFGATPVCTLVASAPIGNDTFTFVTYDGTGGTGHKLSQNTVVQNIVAGQANTVSVTLEGVPVGVLVSPYPNQSNVVQQPGGYELVGTSAANFAVEAFDADNNFIVGPGAPTLTVSSSSASLHVASVANSLNEYVLTPVTSGATVTLNVSAAGGDGGSASGAVTLMLKAPLPTSLPKTAYVYENEAGLGNSTTGEIDVFAAGSVNAATPQKLTSTLLYPDGGSLAWGANGSLFATGNTDQGYLVVDYSAAQLSAGTGPAVAIESYYYNLLHSLPANPNALLTMLSMAVDSRGDVFVVGTPNGFPAAYGVYEWPAGYTATTNPTKLTSASITAPALVYIDASDNLYVVNGSQMVSYSILVYSATAFNATPSRTIGGSNAGFGSVTSLAVGADGTLTAMDGGTDEVYVFKPGATNNPTPEAVFQSSALNWASPITVDANNNVYGSQFFFVPTISFQLEAFGAGSVGVVPPLFNVQSAALYPTYILFGP